MTHVSNSDRVAAAQIRLEQAERLVYEAKRILEYAKKQEHGTDRSTTYAVEEELECET